MPASWKELNECLWDAPSNLITKVPLKEIYISSFQDLDVELDHIAGFFRRTLDIDDIDWLDVISELKELKRQPTIRGEGVCQLVYRVPVFCLYFVLYFDPYLWLRGRRRLFSLTSLTFSLLRIRLRILGSLETTRAELCRLPFSYH
jgi:hypothetical protein